MSKLVVEVFKLSVFAGDNCLVSSLSLALKRGEAVTILGETGSGKSLLAQAIMGALPKELTASGDVCLFGKLNPSLHEREQMWGQQVAMLPQEPWLSLDPLMKSQRQLSLVEELVKQQDAKRARQQAQASLSAMGLAGDGDKVPSQLSGGMAQRLAYLCATAGGADVLIADEPTKGLDDSRKQQVIGLLQQHKQHGALLTITHDIDVAQALDGEIIVMRQGQIVERGSAEDVLNTPRSDYAKALISAHSQDHFPIALKQGNAPLLKVKNLSKQRGNKQLFRDLSFQMGEGEVLGVAGDSGAGKSTLVDIVLGLTECDQGQLERAPELGPGKMLKLYQDPPAAFPREISLGQSLEDLCQLHKLDRSQLPELLARLRLDEAILARRPSAVSGGELQRFAMLRALLMKPKLLVADEPTSRLDPIVAHQTLELLIEQTRKIGCALILVSHNRRVMNQLCHQIVDLSPLEGSQRVPVDFNSACLIK